MKHLLTTIGLVATTLLVAQASASAAPRVVASIKPVHSLVASIMKGIAEPNLILKGGASPHTYQMKPAEAEMLDNAEIVFWIGPELERFLERPLQSIGGDAVQVELGEVSGLNLLPPREGGPFEAHDDHDHAGGEHAAEEHEDDHSHHGAHDAHVWLSTANARVLAAAITKALSDADPANAPRYAANLGALESRLDQLAAEIRATLAPVRQKPFVVFHDAYQYFEVEFDISVAGSITVSPEALPGAARLSEIHEKLKTLGATCVFAEPQFEPRLIDAVIEGTAARKATLDPEAATLTEGPDLYFQLMRGMAGSIRECLSAPG